MKTKQDISNYKSKKHFHVLCDVIIEGKKMNEIVLSPCEKATIQYYYDNLTDERSLFSYLENGPRNERAWNKYAYYCRSVYEKLQRTVDFFTVNPGSLNYEAMQTLQLPLDSCKTCHKCCLCYSTGMFEIFCHFSDEEYDRIMLLMMYYFLDKKYSNLMRHGAISHETDSAIRAKIACFLKQKGEDNADYCLYLDELADDSLYILKDIEPHDWEFNAFSRELDRMLTDEELEEYLKTLSTPSYKDMTDEELEAHLQDLHAMSFANGAQISDSHVCGCFSCGTIFRSDEVTGWIPEQGMKMTAMCPYCGIDAVIGDACGERITPEMLELMGKRFFGIGEDYECDDFN